MNSIKQEAVFAGQTSWNKDGGRRRKLMMIYWIYNLVRMILNLILQCTYLNFKRLGEQVENLEVASNVKWIENLMVKIGHIHRADAATGIFFYAIYFSNVLTFRVARSLFDRRIIKTFSRNEVISFLLKAGNDNKILTERLNDCLDQMIYSNENFTEKIVNRVLIDENSDLDLSELLIDKGFILNAQNKVVPHSQVNYNFRISHSINGITGNSFYSSKSSELKLFNIEEEGEEKEESTEFEMISAEAELIEALRKQREFLIKLKINIDKVWPAYRNIHLIMRLKRIGSLTYITYGFVGWFSGQLSTIAGFNMAYSSLATSSFKPEYRRFNLMDRITCAECHIFTYFIIFSYISDFCIYLVSMLYHLQQLRRLWSKTNQFYGNLNRCEIWQKRNNNNNQYLERNDFILNEQIRRDLKFECDKSLIELYIDYYVFRQGAKSVVKISETATNQIVAFVVIAMIPLLAYLNYIPKFQKPSLITIALLVVMFCNPPFLLCAFFDSACNRFAKNVWSILAFIAEHNHHLYQFSKTSKSSTSIFRKNINFNDKSEINHKVSGGGLSYLLMEQGIKKRVPDYVYYSKSYITPHSMILWHGLVKNHQAVSEGFVSKLYGSFKIDYGGVLRFNHWLVWAWLVTMSI